MLDSVEVIGNGRGGRLGDILLKAPQLVVRFHFCPDNVILPSREEQPPEVPDSKEVVSLFLEYKYLTLLALLSQAHPLVQ